MNSWCFHTIKLCETKWNFGFQCTFLKRLNDNILSHTIFFHSSHSRSKQNFPKVVKPHLNIYSPKKQQILEKCLPFYIWIGNWIATRMKMTTIRKKLIMINCDMMSDVWSYISQYTERVSCKCMIYGDDADNNHHFNTSWTKFIDKRKEDKISFLLPRRYPITMLLL